MSSALSVFADDAFAAPIAGASWTRQSRSAAPENSRTAQNSLHFTLHFTPDSEIYAEGDKAASFYKVVSGVVRTCKFLSDGRRQIDAFYVAGDIFGFEAGDEHKLSAEAVTECSITPYRRRGLETMAADSDGMALKLFSYAMCCLERTREHSLLLGRGTAMQKLAAFLLEMTSGKAAGEVIELAMTRQDIGDYLGLTIETVSRTLSQLERDNVITLSTSRRICLKNRSALQRFNA